jgi:hypothetical protein
MRGAIPPLPQYVFMAWCLVMHTDNFTFTLLANTNFITLITLFIYHVLPQLDFPSRKISFAIVSPRTWSLTSREEHGLRVFENSVLRRIFGPKREKDWSWRK